MAAAVLAAAQGCLTRAQEIIPPTMQGLLRDAKSSRQLRRIAELEKEVEGRDQVIGELTIANRILKKLSGESR